MKVDDVEIDNADAADARRGQIQAQRRAESARADQQHFRLLQLQLAFHAHFRHDQMAAVAQQFLRSKASSPRSVRPRSCEPPAMLGTIESVSLAFSFGVASLSR